MNQLMEGFSIFSVFAFFFRFVSVFGTHFVDDLQLGSRMGVESEITSAQWSKLNSANIDLNLAASLSAGYMSGTLSGGVKTGKSAR